MNNKYQFYFKKFLLSLIIVLFIIGSAINVSADTVTYTEFKTLLTEIKAAVAKENKALALDLLEKAIKMLSKLEKRHILDEEALLWDSSQLNLDRAEGMQDPDQGAHFANLSIIKWQEYIEWYKSLKETQLEIITDNPTSFRIQRAVRQLGNAYMKRANIKDYSIREMFATYGDLNPKYLSSKSMHLWRNLLFRCPSWKPITNTSLRGLKVKFDNGHEYCKEDWEDFHGFLEEWIIEQDLTTSKKKKYQRWLKDLGYALDYED